MFPAAAAPIGCHVTWQSSCQSQARHHLAWHGPAQHSNIGVPNPAVPSTNQGTTGEKPGPYVFASLSADLSHSSPLAVQVTASPHTFCLTRSPLSTAVSSSPPAVWVCLKMGYPGTPFHPEVHQLPSGWFSYSKTPCLDVGIYRWLHPCGVGQPLHVGHWAIGPWSSSHQSLLSQTR